MREQWLKVAHRLASKINPQQPVKELQNLDATDNVALFFSFIHMLLKKIKQYS